MRSLLYVPAFNSKLLAKSKQIKADALIFDLEDSCPPEGKEEARENLQQALEDETSSPYRLVRVNGPASDQLDLDLALVAKAIDTGQIHGLVLPKIDSGFQIQGLENQLEALGLNQPFDIWAMIETPLGVLNVEKIAASSTRLKGFILGLEDLSKTLGLAMESDQYDRLSFTYQRVNLAAKAFGMLAIDSVCRHFRDQNLLRKQCQAARALGYDGKSLIHPNQIDPCHEIFSITQEQVDEAHVLIDAFEVAEEQGQFVANHQGQMVERLHFEQAKALVLKFKQEQKT